jgi:hypothetical protein
MHFPMLSRQHMRPKPAPSLNLSLVASIAYAFMQSQPASADFWLGKCFFQL